MKASNLSILILCVISFVAVSTCFAGDSKIYGCVSNNGGALRIVSGPDFCKSTESPTVLSGYTGVDYAIYGHVTSTGGQADSGTFAGFSVSPRSYGPAGVYDIQFSLSSETTPACVVTSKTTAQCEVTSKGANSVTISCAQPTISGSDIIYTPVASDFEFMCID